MGFSVRLKGHDSWLDPESAGLLGWKLGKRLVARIAGREGRFITLTYDRARYVDAQDCFDQARSRKHVSRFMRKLGALLGVDLRGKWLCKLEFQREGWVHWHIVLVDVGMIPRDKFARLYELWGRGSINVKPLTEENARYLMKYVAKDGDIPGWVYDYPARSIKVVRHSSGFWLDEQASRSREVTRRSRELYGSRRRAERDEFRTPVGYVIGKDAALIKADDGRVFSVRCSREDLRAVLRSHCKSEPELDGTWRRYPDESSRTLAAVVRACEAASTAAIPSAGAQTTRTPAQPLFLRGTGKRARWWAVFVDGCWEYLSPEALAGKWSAWWAVNAPWWVKRSWEQDGRSFLPDALEAAWRRSPEGLAWAR